MTQQPTTTTQYSRPTIALCCILKDEIKNLPQLLRSVEGCFDEIHLTDTGSTDGSIEYIKEHQIKWMDTGSNIANTPIFLKTFEWCDDFAKARNHSMKGVTTDFVMWMDLDDVLSDKEAFKRWRDHVMMLGDFWMAPYYYGFDEHGNPNCTFLRERIVRTAKKFEWQYFIHEGMIPTESVQAQAVSTWQVHHKRTREDYEKDFTRNVSMLENYVKAGKELPIRLKFYYGKELFDKQRFQEAYVWLDQIIDNKELQAHDRILTFEYLMRSSIQRFFIEQMHKAKEQQDKTLVAKSLSLGLQALALAPQRAEFWCLIADCFELLEQPMNAIPCLEAAKSCTMNEANSTTFLFTSVPAYTFVPANKLAVLKQMKGDLDGAIFEAKVAFEKFKHPDTEKILNQLLTVKQTIVKGQNPNKVETNEIVISCIPNSHPYEFDDAVYGVKGIGGSETALVEVAKHLRLKTKKPVIVFNTRQSEYVSPEGVVYKPAQQMWEYFCGRKPEVHIAWRHNVKLTDAPTYLWCHDLTTPGAEKNDVYEKIICLSNFHKNYVQVQQGIPTEKIVVSRNGVNISRFETKKTKKATKIVWPSSADRGLDRAMDIVEKARLRSGVDFELHVYYGMDNMKKYPGPYQQMAIDLEKKMSERPWVKYHGNVEQKHLAQEMLEAVMWLYPANFIETYCITVLEAICAGVYPIVREIGALKDTVRPFSDRDMADLVFLDAATEDEKNAWADLVIDAYNLKKWENVSMGGLDYSWEGVADQFMEFMKIGTETESGEFDQILRDVQVYTPSGQIGLQDIGV